MTKKQAEPTFKPKKVSKLTAEMFKRADVGVDIDKLFPKQTWEDVDNLYNAIAQAIISIGEQVNQCVRTINEADISSKEIVVTINGITNDINSFTNDLIKIKKRHEGKSGDIENENDHALSVSVYTDYVTLQERVTGLTFSNMLTVTEYFNEAAEVIKARDANEITDVELKEVKQDA
ncbi:MAG: hypothetical protein M0Q87_13285 [Ottowia sp.]|nr:hypothetical protein [Ottowia sp.]